ncbi:MAG: PAS domain-containing protein [Gammaproteobacteria bacterium]|nr:PAS domain-containing protein [Gammaproteobacteria bacterium]
MNMIDDSLYSDSDTGNNNHHIDNTIEYNEFTSSLINSIFETSKDAVFGTDSKGIIRFANNNCEKLFLISRKRMLGKHYSGILCGKDRQCKAICNCQCPIHRNINQEEQIQEHTLTIGQTNGNEIQVNLGTCYFYQPDENEVCTFFSIKSANN